MKYLPDDWDILLLGHCGLYCTHYLPLAEIEVCKVSDYNCTHAYIIRNAKVANWVSKFAIASKVLIADVFLKKYLGVLNVYAFIPQLVVQKRSTFGTDIESSCEIPDDPEFGAMDIKQEDF